MAKTFGGFATNNTSDRIIFDDSNADLIEGVSKAALQQVIEEVDSRLDTLDEFDLENTISQLSNKSITTVNIETITADKQLNLDSAHHQELTNNSGGDINILLPEDPVEGLTFLIANSINSTNNLIVNSTNVLPNTLYEVRWVGYWKVI